mmetsp:Transcript_12137/g.18319  ORF Transcript_12137/g.18319 Transcript_12137/m.18319 type:complete len:103 (-) Transcript_12137:1888-2196(-)
MHKALSLSAWMPKSTPIPLGHVCPLSVLRMPNAASIPQERELYVAHPTNNSRLHSRRSEYTFDSSEMAFFMSFREVEGTANAAYSSLQIQYEVPPSADRLHQ